MSAVQIAINNKKDHCTTQIRIELTDLIGSRHAKSITVSRIVTEKLEKKKCILILCWLKSVSVRWVVNFYLSSRLEKMTSTAFCAASCKKNS